VDRTVNPLRAAVPKEIPLDNAPLVRVIGQVRFPLIGSIDDDKSIAPLQEKVKSTFPILRKEILSEHILTPSGPQKGQDKTIWRFQDVEQNWRFSLAPGFLALETTNYHSRADFLSEMETVYRSVDEIFGISIIDRIGLRYIDKITISQTDDILTLISPELCGILTTALAADAELSLQENILNLSDIEGKLRARWGLIPPKSTVDPSAIEPSMEQTWILDLDAYSMPKKKFSVSEIMSLLEKFAEKSYSVFRWVITDEFLKKFGGEI
jgi:uncharacterized protein (TIGR04255 family)